MSKGDSEANQPRETVFIGLGSNQQQPLQQLQSALARMALVPDVDLVDLSSYYQTPPVGPQDQPDYVNAVACLETALEPTQLLDQLQKIEHAQGRVRDQRWGPRTLDLDILLFGDRIIADERLTVPHPEMHKRCFVLVPLAELQPDITIPRIGSIGTLLAKLDCRDIRKLSADAE